MPNLIRFGTGGRGASISAPIIGEDFNWTGGDGTCQVIDDGGGDWRIKFLSSGTFTGAVKIYAQNCLQAPAE